MNLRKNLDTTKLRIALRKSNCIEKVRSIMETLFISGILSHPFQMADTSAPCFRRCLRCHQKSRIRSGRQGRHSRTFHPCRPGRILLTCSREGDAIYCFLLWLPIIVSFSKKPIHLFFQRSADFLRLYSFLIGHCYAAAKTSDTADTCEASCSWRIAPCIRNQARRNQ